MLQRLEVIDFLRGFSIFTIVLMHLLQSYPIPPFLMAASSFGGVAGAAADALVGVHHTDALGIGGDGLLGAGVAAVYL